MSSKRTSVPLCLSIFALSLLGCKNSASTTANNAATATAVAENLSAADKLDGSEDHIVSKCYSCALAMDGAANISSKYHEYTVHHCSEACKERFTDKADTIVINTKIPSPKSEDAEVTGPPSQ